MSETNKQLARKWILEMVSPDSVVHEAGDDVLGPEGLFLFFECMQAAFSEIRVTVHDDMA